MSQVKEEKPVVELVVLGEKKNRHVAIAMSHLNKRRDLLLDKQAGLTKEIEEIDAALLALE